MQAFPVKLVLSVTCSHTQAVHFCRSDLISVLSVARFLHEQQTSDEFSEAPETYSDVICKILQQGGHPNQKSQYTSIFSLPYPSYPFSFIHFLSSSLSLPLNRAKGPVLEILKIYSLNV